MVRHALLCSPAPTSEAHVLFGCEPLQVSKISGGISNILSKVTPPATSGLAPVAVKVFGDKTELLIDRCPLPTYLVVVTKQSCAALRLLYGAICKCDKIVSAGLFMDVLTSDCLA